MAMVIAMILCRFYVSRSWNLIGNLSHVWSLELELEVFKFRFDKQFLVILLLFLLESFVHGCVLQVLSHLLVGRSVLTAVGVFSTVD